MIDVPKSIIQWARNLGEQARRCELCAGKAVALACLQAGTCAFNLQFQPKVARTNAVYIAACLLSQRG
jgi:hypothetical protein